MKVLHAMAVLAALSLVSPVSADTIALPIPALASPGTSTWSLGRADLFFEANALGVMLVGENDERREFTVPFVVAEGEPETFPADLRAQIDGLRRRLTRWLVDQGHVTGTLVVE